MLQPGGVVLPRAAQLLPPSVPVRSPHVSTRPKTNRIRPFYEQALELTGCLRCRDPFPRERHDLSSQLPAIVEQLWAVLNATIQTQRDCNGWSCLPRANINPHREAHKSIQRLNQNTFFGLNCRSTSREQIQRRPWGWYPWATSGPVFH